MNERSKSRVNIIVSNLFHGTIHRALFIECKRPMRNISPPSSKTWASSKSQLQKHMAGWGRRHFGKPLFGMVCIGPSIRSYEMGVGAKTPKRLALPGLIQRGLSIKKNPDLVQIYLNKGRTLIDNTFM
jgi:hypothetical protein